MLQAGSADTIGSDLFALQILVVTGSEPDCELLRQGAGATALPVEIFEARDASEARRKLFGDIDIVLIDGSVPDVDRAAVIKAAKASSRSPFVVQMVERGALVPEFNADALAIKPATAAEAKTFVRRCMRVRITSRVLVVDDSSTMRSIVRKVLAASRFPLDISEAAEGLVALKLVRNGDFDLMFLDHNMPDFSGLETLSELRRERRRVDVVLMTAVGDDSLSERAREGGAAFLKKPFYPADIDAVLCAFYGLRALNPNRK